MGQGSRTPIVLDDSIGTPWYQSTRWLWCKGSDKMSSWSELAGREGVASYWCSIVLGISWVSCFIQMEIHRVLALSRAHRALSSHPSSAFVRPFLFLQACTPLSISSLVTPSLISCIVTPSASTFLFLLSSSKKSISSYSIPLSLCILSKCVVLLPGYICM